MDMSEKPAATKFKKEFDRLEQDGKPFLIVDVAHRLHSTSKKCSFELRQRKNVICIERPTGKGTGLNYVMYQFLKGVKDE